MNIRQLFINKDRSSNVKKNVIEMFFIKGGSILINLLLVPITLNYVDSSTYGIWLTLSSMVAWISFFDIGINNGLKNNLTEAFAHHDLILAKKLVSTAYVFLICVFVPLMAILLIINPSVDWSSLLKVDLARHELVIAISIIISYFCLNFILSTINIVLLADQRPSDSSLRSFIQQAISLIVIFILTLFTKGNLPLLCIGLCLPPLIVVIYFNITLFSKRYKDISPSLKYIDFSILPRLLKLGVLFFVIQIAGVIQFQMVNFLIIRYYGPAEVTAYNISYKYFNVLYMVWNILITPLWAAVTDASAMKDYKWIQSIVKKYRKYFILFAVVALLMLVCSAPVYSVWVGDKVVIPFTLSLFIMIYNVLLIFGSTYVMVLNGLGEVKIQAIICTISPAVFLGIFMLCKQSTLGVAAIVFASIIANFNGFVVAPIQYKTIIKKVCK